VQQFRPRRWWLGLAIGGGLSGLLVVLLIIGSTRVSYVPIDKHTGLPLAKKKRFIDPPPKNMKWDKPVPPDFIEEDDDDGVDNPRRQRPRWSDGVLTLLSILLVGSALVGAYCLFQTVRTFNLAVDLHEGGVRYRAWWTQIECLWGDVRCICFERAYRLHPAFFEVIREDGRTILLGNRPLSFMPLADVIVIFGFLFIAPLPKSHVLYAAIRRSAAPVLKAKALAALMRGERVEYADNLFLLPDGIHYPPHHLTWDEIGEARVLGNFLKITHHEPREFRFSIPTKSVYNVDGLLDILDDRDAVAALRRLPQPSLEERAEEAADKMRRRGRGR
jgi:hypothetical protein